MSIPELEARRVCKFAQNDERREFLVKMRRDAGFETRLLAVVIAFDHLAHLMKPGNDRRLLRAARTTP